MSEAFLQELAAERRAYARPPRLRALAEQLAREVMALLFPHFAADVPGCTVDDVSADLARVRQTLRRALGPLAEEAGRPAEAIVASFVAALPAVHAALLDDARATLEGDPAATSLDEVVAAYPGFHAIALHRVAHALRAEGVPLLPRLLAETAHRETGIDIHPGARIGRSFSIDHGTGVVIGETAEIGDRVKLYQGVTLGAASVAKALASTKRHPTLGDEVVVYANATILGGETVVGAGSVIGGNVWLTRSVPPRSVVTHQSQVARRPGYDGVEDFSI
jgi:serine O-acetyltransferase